MDEGQQTRANVSNHDKSRIWAKVESLLAPEEPLGVSLVLGLGHRGVYLVRRVLLRRGGPGVVQALRSLNPFPHVSTH